ncbi:MAG: 50S ribosomal protein L4 [Alphaproteobacteria bacterium]|nr:MAG: 50S ribosomal protein L4 [Alphaproteobacteria bacterium]
MNFDIISLDGNKTGSVDLPTNVFGLEIRTDLLARAVNWQLANNREWLAHTKTRGEIDRSKKKHGPQKKSGNARHGARSSNIFVGGAVVHGPRNRTTTNSLPKQVRALALKVALSSKVSTSNLIIVDEAALAAPKTKQLAALLTKLNAMNATFIVDSFESNFDLASRNLPHIKVIPTAGANVYDILQRDKLVLTSKAVSLLVARLSGEEGETVAATKAPAAVKAEKPAAAKKPATKKSAE